jgi:hypothetical protein
MRKMLAECMQPGAGSLDNEEGRRWRLLFHKRRRLLHSFLSNKPRRRVEVKRKKRRCAFLTTLVVTVSAILVVLSPFAVAYVCSSLLGNPIAYVVTKNETSKEEMIILAFR